MNNYLVCMRQYGEGCDYTIGCGMKYKVVGAENREEAIEKVLYPDGRDEGYSYTLDGEQELVELVVTEFTEGSVVNLEPYKNEFKEAMKAEAEQTEKDKRRKEYLLLKQEFDNE